MACKRKKRRSTAGAWSRNYSVKVTITPKRKAKARRK